MARKLRGMSSRESMRLPLTAQVEVVLALLVLATSAAGQQASTNTEVVPSDVAAAISAPDGVDISDLLLEVAPINGNNPAVSKASSAPKTPTKPQGGFTQTQKTAGTAKPTTNSAKPMVQSAERRAQPNAAKSPQNAAARRPNHRNPPLYTPMAAGTAGGVAAATGQPQQVPVPTQQYESPSTQSPAQVALPPFTSAMPSDAGQISPSILVMGRFDWDLSTDANGKPWSRCLDMVWRAKRLNRGNRLNFIPTHHWLPGEGGYGVGSFCFQHNDGNGNLGCSAWSRPMIRKYQAGMTLCFAEALRQGFIPYIRPHLDDGLGRGTWRNDLMFSPTVKYGGFSYQELMTDPLSAALAQALKITASEGTLWPVADRARPVVYIALQGEMSATIMRYTQDWMSLIPAIHQRLSEPGLADVKIGIGLNFNNLDAIQGSASQVGGVLGWLFNTRSAAPAAPAINAAAVKELVEQKIDFLGISAYAPYTGPGMPLNEFENSAFNVAESLRNLGGGVNLAELINNGKVELHYSEFGLGGGRQGNADAAYDGAAAGRQPWAGVAGPYSYSTDPWQNRELRNFRTEFYGKALQWMANPFIKTYRVSEIFVWGMASWDLWGTYPDSMKYRDVDLVRKISKHNMEVVGAKVLAQQGPDAAAVAWKTMTDADEVFAPRASMWDR